MTPTPAPDPAEALRAIQRAAAEGRIEFASSSVTAALDAEVQTIYETIRVAETGKPPKRPVWASDESILSDCLPWDDDGNVTPAGQKAVAIASAALGIPLSASDTWAAAALRLHAHRSAASAKD